MEKIELKFEVKGAFKAKQSVKFTKTGMRYTPKDVVAYSNWIRNSFIMTYPEHKPEDLEGYYLRIDIIVFYKIPESFSKKKRELALANMIRPDKKPDWDNISKNICDALNGIAYPDDKAIVDGHVQKYYGTSEGIIIILEGFKF